MRIQALRAPRAFSHWVVTRGIAASVAFFSATAEAERRADVETEFTPAPIIGGSSDIGFGGGVIASYAKVKPGMEPDPSLYRIQFATTTTVKSELGKIKIPFQDDYVLVHLPHLFYDLLELDLRVSFTHEATQKYYGIGNAVTVPENVSLNDPFYEYKRTHAAASADGTLHIARPVSLLLRIAYVQNWLDVPPNTKLVQDSLHGSETVRNLLEPFDAHGVVTFSYGIAFDTRDDRVTSTRGQYHTTRVDLSPGGAPGVPQRWAEWNTNLRWYFPIGTDGSALALRAMADLLFGSPPFYELSRFDDTGALGGPSGVRGIPAQRYSGMIKLLGNIELRKMLFDFHFLSKMNRFGIAAFADTGRVFATYSAQPALDGTSLGLKLGVGGGMRVAAGKSFVLRADAAWSPDARPLSVYIAAGQSF